MKSRTSAGSECFNSLRQILSLEPSVKQLKLRYKNCDDTSCDV